MLLASGCSDEYDDSALTGRVDDLENRVKTLEELCRQMNTNISSLQTLVTALQNSDYITSVTPVTSGGQTIGYTMTFKHALPITIYHGTNGKDGQDGTDGKDGQDGKNGTTPVIGVALYNGVYYWMLNGTWLTDTYGNKIKAEGTDGRDGVDGRPGTDGKPGQDGDDGQDGKPGEDGEDGITPQLKIENEYWYISYDNGASWTQLGQATGNDGKDGDTLFSKVDDQGKEVVFTLTNGTVITIPKGDNSQFAIHFDKTEITALNAGETISFEYTITAATDETLVRAISQNGWKATVVPASTSTGKIYITAPDPLVAGEVLILANDGTYRTVMTSIQCKEKVVLIIADNSFDIPAEGKTQQIELQTNIAYTVNIPTDAKSWLSVIETRAMRDETLTFTIAANEAISQRFATVTLDDSNGHALQSIIFHQAGNKVEGTLEVHVETAGTLDRVLSEYDISTVKAMKITGVLNDKDFLVTNHEMPALTDLDLSEVNITELPTRSFYGGTTNNLENLVLPQTLTTIADQVFQNSKLKNIQIFGNLTTIGASAFSGCTFLSTITIPANVTTIGASAFSGCTALSTVTFENESNLSALNDNVFRKCIITNIRIPAKVATISSTAFAYCNALQTVSFEENSCLTTLTRTFAGLPALQRIAIPASVETIDGTFSGCTSLPTVTFESGSKLRTIGSGAFRNCTELTAIEIPASVVTIKDSAFKGCTSLPTVTFESGSKLTTIGGGSPSSPFPSDYYGAFSDCSKLAAIEIPASVVTIEAAAFKNCTSLATVTFESGSKLTTIGGGSSYVYYSYYYGAFSDCSKLDAIEIPANVETIEASAFKNCTSLATVTFESGSKLTTIGGGYSQSYYYGVFSDCSKLSTIKIPANVETIEASAFKGCTSLATVTFENGSKLKTIGGGYYYKNYFSSSSPYYSDYYGAFSDCAQLATIEIPASVETIEMAAFEGCTSLATVTFEPGSRLKTIGGSYAKIYKTQSSYFYDHYGAFSNCSKLDAIELPTSVETIQDGAFSQCTALEKIEFGDNSMLKTIGERAFYECPAIHRIYASNCSLLTSIGDYAFNSSDEIYLFEIGTAIPPKCGTRPFGMLRDYSILKVPAGCVDAYKAVMEWTAFTNISEL